MNAAGFVDVRRGGLKHPPGTYAGGGTSHFISILGRAADGKYVVGDPMFSGGTVALTAAELRTFLGSVPTFAAV